MDQDNAHRSLEMTKHDRKGSPWGWLVGLGCAAVVLLAILAPRGIFTQRELGRTSEATTSNHAQSSGSEGPARLKSNPTAEEIVANKLDQFARDRLRITRAMARRGGAELPEEVDQFFNAVAANRWDELNDLYRKLEKIRDSGNDNLRSVWAPILETLLVAECAHAWPAQKLLDYGQATLGSLAPGMIYVGGTDPGRGIPTLLNETSGGERHVIL